MPFINPVILKKARGVPYKATVKDESVATHMLHRDLFVNAYDKVYRRVQIHAGKIKVAAIYERSMLPPNARIKNEKIRGGNAGNMVGTYKFKERSDGGKCPS